MQLSKIIMTQESYGYDLHHMTQKGNVALLMFIWTLFWPRYHHPPTSAPTNPLLGLHSSFVKTVGVHRAKMELAVRRNGYYLGSGPQAFGPN